MPLVRLDVQHGRSPAALRKLADTVDGRSIDQKTAGYAELAKRLESKCDLRPEDLIVSVVANEAADWSFGRGRAESQRTPARPTR